MSSRDIKTNVTVTVTAEQVKTLVIDEIMKQLGLKNLASGRLNPILKEGQRDELIFGGFTLDLSLDELAKREK